MLDQADSALFKAKMNGRNQEVAAHILEVTFMLSRRNEAFRYIFSPPLHCHFNIALENEPNKVTHYGNAEIHNISPHGLMLSTKLNIPQNRDMIRVSIKFTLEEMNFLVSGHFRWKKTHTGEFMYGVLLDTDKEVERKIINQLKIVSKRKHNLL
ncbi:PilZ domain-containing protein [Bacillus sp. FJAT-49732]|uniref:PilZ domain-containing protein n=1 Tax=Lederbergia citrisecunda TaxID=2833583 RepID=A0A942TRI4_9BACI|nr:PilZ domain-containing protein [Lederbergia citrisecunda]MBS4200534.1 PilZ domain-containing protein [Lederbergia citrisecunda]